jgi:sulfite exporter TauE/SafE
MIHHVEEIKLIQTQTRKVEMQLRLKIVKNGIRILSYHIIIREIYAENL